MNNIRYNKSIIIGSIILYLIGAFGCSEKPANWYYYWEKDNVISGLDATGSPASRYTSNTSYYGGASGSDNGYVITDLCIDSPVMTPYYVWHKITYIDFYIGATTTFGIQQVAATMAHEKKHIDNYQLIQGGYPDTDKDGLADTHEGVSPYFFIIGDKDTYSLKDRIHEDYAKYGDNEFIARVAEVGGLALANLNADWSKGGAQWQQ